MILYRHSALKIVAQHEVAVEQRAVLPVCLLHHTDAPVDVGTQPKAQIVWGGFGDGGQGIERLMADQHAVQERPPRELLGRGEATAVEKASLVVDDVGVAVEYTGQGRGLSDSCQIGRAHV